MASILVSGPTSDGVDTEESELAPPDNGAALAAEASEEAGAASSGTGETDQEQDQDLPAPLDWSDNEDGHDLANFFGPDHGRLSRTAIVVIGAILVVASIAALVIGTSGGGAKSAGSPSTKAGAHRVSTVSGAKATAGLLALSDLPAGWTGAGSQAVTHGPAWSKRLASCVGVPSRVANATPPKASSPVFTSADKTAALEESVSQYATPAQALAEYKAIASSKTPGCIDSVGASALRSSIQNEAGAAATVGTVSITRIPPGTLKPHETGIRVTIPLSTSAGNLTINSTEVDFVKGTLFEQLNFNGNGNPFPPLLEVQLINAAMQRAG